VGVALQGADRVLAGGLVSRSGSSSSLLTACSMAIIIGTLYVSPHLTLQTRLIPPQLLFGAFPIVFQEARGWSPGIGGLAFIGVLVGCMLAVVYSVVYENPKYERKLKVCPVLPVAGSNAEVGGRKPAGGCGRRRGCRRLFLGESCYRESSAPLRSRRVTSVFVGL
jgi:hypothetical protein